ncbi:rasGAP-activating-like protein 1 isoform X2 [Glandiceps talaboti]
MARNTSIYLRIGEGKNLPAKDITGSSDPYSLVKIDNEVVARTATVWKTLEPFWGEEYTLHLPSGFHNLSVYVYDEDTLSVDDIIGKVSLDKELLDNNPRAGIERWFKLRKVNRDTEVQGEVHINLTLVVKNNQKTIRCQIIEARDLAAKDKTGTSDPFAKLTYNGVNKTTQTIRRTRFPRWYETFEFEITESLKDAVIYVTVWDWDRLGNNDYMGRIELRPSDLEPNKTYDKWIRLKPRQVEEEDDGPDLGSLRLKVRCSEERILPSQYYQPLIDLLVESVSQAQPEGSTPLNMLEEVMTLDKIEVATTLVKIFLGQGMVLPFLDVLITQEVIRAKDTNTLFRGNTLATKSVDQFMKVIGMPYLHETLGPVIDKIFNERKLLELDPDKLDVLRRRMSLKTTSANQLLEQSTATLTAYLVSIINCILMSVDRCPPIMRLAFKQLRKRVEDRFPDSEHEDIKYLCISGFLFLRFFAPAILSPKLFSLRELHADKYICRTLTLLAKGIQSIGNLGAQLGKEQYMEPLYPVIMDSAIRIKDFLDRLIDIDEAEAQHDLDYLKVSPGEIQQRSVFHHSMTIKEGYLRKRRGEDIAVVTPFTFKKRYFWLSNETLSYAKEPEIEVRSTIQIPRVCAVERVDCNSFQRPYMMQVIYKDSEGNHKTLYMQAKDVNDMHQWLSAIRKTCVSNTHMLDTFHPGAYRGSRWTCCLQTAKSVRGCSKTHSACTLGDWRDPLDPDAETQTIYSQLLLGTDMLRTKYLESSDLGNAAADAMHQTELTVNGDSKDAEDDQSLKKSQSFHDSRMAAAATLLDVIGDMARAHRAFEIREKEHEKESFGESS